ncbi:hypothetical protein BN863_960 [Formosa agariphila KMM 3901]|uniref:Uncharacterized protein n=1 Tax=Formosa agariphila (strain DSM 15362 / KCTC 12365 / LMG 23005 / KMM 3901 / M-2Alg 35-1) TaxID=1347342 RepID=T2KHF0_FORAG|nr:hypothetical protein [Formosa agariphila]CDF77808.1 hypothetical protein BN863_960 [Formosa agariphila KMM 3901]
MKAPSTIKLIAFRGIILAMACCYIISPLKHSLFDMIHVVSHYVEDHILLTHKKDASIFKVHTQNSYQYTNTLPLVNHSHTATGKVIPNHSHQVLAVLDYIISTSEEQNDHQKSIFKAEIDKHLLTSECRFKSKIIHLTTKKRGIHLYRLTR